MIIHQTIHRDIKEILESVQIKDCIRIVIYIAEKIFDFLPTELKPQGKRVIELISNIDSLYDVSECYSLGRIMDEYYHTNVYMFGDIENKKAKTAFIFGYIADIGKAKEYYRKHNIQEDYINVISTAIHSLIVLDYSAKILDVYSAVTCSFLSRSTLEVKPTMANLISLDDPASVLALLDELEELGENIIQEREKLRLNLPEKYEILGENKLELAENIIKDKLAFEWLQRIYHK